jgi:hypothetical protein
MKEVAMRAKNVLILIVLTILSVYSISPAYAQPVPEVSDSLIDIGVVPKSISRSKPFYVRNVGDATLIINNVIVSNAINFSASPIAFAVEPGDSEQVNITLTPWWELGIFTTTITVVSFNAQPDSIHLEAIGEGIPDAPLISVTPMALSATLNEGGQSIQQLRIQNVGSVPLNWSRSTSDPAVRVTYGTTPLDPLAWRDLTVTFPYTPVPAGEYHYTITFTSDDPYNPTLIVPVDLFIPGNPIATADPDSIDFGLIHFGYPSESTLSVSNTGTGMLHVSDITSNNGDFSVAPKVFDVGSSSSQDVTVTCDPTVVGTIDGILTIASDDPVNPAVDVYVTAIGTDLTPPVLGASLDTIEVTVAPGGRTNRMLEINNLGQSDLNWNASIAPSSLEVNLDGMRVLVDESRGFSGFFAGYAEQFIDAMTAAGAEVIENSHHMITPSMLALYDAAIVPYGGGNQHAQSELDAFRGFVLDGGGLMLHAATFGRKVSMNSLLSSLGAGISFPGLNDDTSEWVTDILAAEFTAGIDSIYQSEDNAIISVESPGVVFANNDEHIHGAYFEDVGRVIVLANKVYHNSDVSVPDADNLQLMLQMCTWLYQMLPGRSLTPKSGVTPGGSTSKLFVYFDATDLEEGTYTADILLTHEWPGAVPVTVPTIMIVDSAATAIEIQKPRRDLVLYQNHPNPFNPLTTIMFHLPASSQVNLSVYNVEGREVKSLVDTELDAGLQKCQWDGTDLHGTPVSSGVYFYRLKAAGKTLTKKMVLLK